MDERKLGETLSIAHSAMMALCLIDSPSPNRYVTGIRGLCDGIIHQQRGNGSFKIYFGNEPDQGEEFYAGEAMVGVLRAYEFTKDEKYLRSIEKAFPYYRYR